MVREPYARILSAWLNKMADDAPRRLRRLPGHGDTGSEGFERFLRWLDDGGLCVKRHWTPQVDLLFQPHERFSRFARLETLAEDMAACPSDLGHDPAPAERLVTPHRLGAGTRKITGAANRLDAFYSDTGRDIVRRLYREDFEALGYAA